MSNKDLVVGGLVLVAGVNGVKAAEVKGVTETQVKVGWRYYTIETGLAMETDGVATTYIVPGSGGFTKVELQKLMDAQEAAKAFLADIPVAMWNAKYDAGFQFNEGRGTEWISFINSVGLPGLVRREFGGVNVVVRMREATVETLVDGKIVKASGWEAFVKATDPVSEDSENATVVFGDWYAAIGLAAKEVFAKLPW